jgi:ASC-1-like (ASCH) protein/ABC-type dipeptide/oligopeptide/nickel transport system ATPase subunit
MYPLYVISGISGSGKTTLGREISKMLSSDNIHFIDQDLFYLTNKPKITLSDGSVTSNWDCYDSLNPEFFSVINETLKLSPVLISGFALSRQILPCRPTIHIHLITASNPEDLMTRCCSSRKHAKSINISRDALMVKEFVIPFYHKTVRESDITHLLPVFDEIGNRLPLDFLVKTISNIILESKITSRELYHKMNVSEPYHSLIKSGIKPVEGRKISSTWKYIRTGDIITMTCHDKQSFDVVVTGITRYLPSIGDPLTEYLTTETLERTLPGVSSIEEGRKIYLQWSTESEIQKCGMMGIQLKVL